MGKMIVKGVMYGGGDCANQNLAPEFSESSTYAVDDYVIYQDDLYQCTTAVSTAGSWDNTKWTRTQITDEMGGSSVSALEDLTDVDITNPAANDTIKWNPTTQKWENGAGGGCLSPCAFAVEHVRINQRCIYILVPKYLLNLGNRRAAF